MAKRERNTANALGRERIARQQALLEIFAQSSELRLGRTSRTRLT